MRPTDKELAKLLRELAAKVLRSESTVNERLFDTAYNYADALERQPAPTFEDLVESVLVQYCETFGEREMAREKMTAAVLRAAGLDGGR